MREIDVMEEFTRVLRIEGEAVLACLERLQENDARRGLASAVSLLGGALDRGGKIVVTGVGKSGKVAQKISATLCSTGSLSVFLHPTEGLHGDLGMITASDAVLALSHTGNTDELVRLLPSLKKLRVPIIGIGGNARSQLAEHCNAWIDAAVSQEACPHNLAPTTSTTLALALGDALALALMKARGFDAEAFARLHPGGTLGRRLNLAVTDVMHSGEAVGVVGASASMDEVIVVSTQKKLGAVLVTEGRSMLGIITDGDLRRALRHRERFFRLRADEVMTRTPVTVRADTRATEALDLMENRPSQISVLPVIDSQGDWVGIVRLHDLVKTL